MINDKDIIEFVGNNKTAVLSEDENGIYSLIVEGTYSYKFIKDALGIDSYTLKAFDKNGNSYSLNYGESLYEQFIDLNIDSGVMQIEERNIYNDITALYNVYFIKEGYQPASILIKDSDNNQLELSNGQNYDTICIKTVVNYVDPYTFIRINHTFGTHTEVKYYDLTAVENLEISGEGNYEISIIDRFGNSKLYYFTIGN